MKLLKTIRLNWPDDALNDTRSWGEGEWQKEPGMNSMLVFEHEGFTCVARRNLMGSWCGYVGIPKDIAQPKDGWDFIDVHGGITFKSDFLAGIENENLYWIGFDCSHLDDIMPKHTPLMKVIEDQKDEGSLALKKVVTELNKIKGGSKIMGTLSAATYKSLKFVKGELKRMIKQIKELPK